MKRFLYIFLLSFAVLSLSGQDLGVKTNILYNASMTLNLGAEVALNDRSTLDISGSYNPWGSSTGKRMKLWMVQPEYRYWLCEKFNGHFFGVHAHVGQYNFSQVSFTQKLKDNNYQGDFYGAGLSYGYQWILSDRWGIEASLGLGYAHFKYDKYPCGECGAKIKSDTKNYWGPTKANISLTYFIF
ncbi:MULTISPECIES: DUF3575 domain-containing protein [unclassified Dysgonomonas]|uniref:DUF3575 domain-containing protein n=1 Tax=unclassified Dysgonomonas TaxID=2630389 RepID=UPI0013E9D6D9|nr:MULTISPECIES: DUF3575 domain-containing protein [unclassified Dysgonomonas]